MIEGTANTASNKETLQSSSSSSSLSLSDNDLDDKDKLLALEEPKMGDRVKPRYKLESDTMADFVNYFERLIAFKRMGG